MQLNYVFVAVIKQTLMIPSCKINKKILKKICKVLDEARAEMKDEKREARLTIEIKMKRKSLEFNSTNEFLLQDIPNELKSISFDLSKYFDYGHRIEIDLDFEMWSTPKIVVSGEKSVWVNGVVKELEEIFNEQPTKHSLLHERKTLIPIITGLAIILGLVASMIYSINDPVGVWIKFLNGNSNLPTGFISGMSSIGISWVLLQWLFPIVEVEGVGIQQKIRKGIIAIVVMISIAVVAAMIYDQISSYFQKTM